MCDDALCIDGRDISVSKCVEIVQSLSFPTAPNCWKLRDLQKGNVEW